MASSQTGPTPRRTTRRSTATPVRDVSPSAHSTRAASTALQDTPANRRATRATSRKLEQPRDAVNSNVLPEVQTRQSYAYGSSKTPLLPEQLHARDTLTMKQVADQVDSAVSQAVQNLNSHAADLEESRKQAQAPSGARKATRGTSRDLSPPASVTTEVQKKQRTAAWASSLESSGLEDITEEEQTQLDTPETRRSDPSSFPSGIFDQSYQYERGLRPPRKPPKPARTSFRSRFANGSRAFVNQIALKSQQLRSVTMNLATAAGGWISRRFNRLSNVLFNLPDSRIVSVMTKAFLAMALMAFISYTFCFSYTRFLCNSESTSRLSQTLGSWCGSCQADASYIEFPTNSPLDIQKLTLTLKSIDAQIRNLEARLNSRLDNQVSALHTDIGSLRKEQSVLLQQMEHISNQATQQTGSSEVASPLIPMVNYFSPANGAIVNVKITSPTRQAPIALPLRLMTRILGIQKYSAHNPVTALEPWHDVGDCWCAAATIPGQDSIRLGVSVREYIYPTELVIEHPPRDVTLTPETAPKHIELWADFGHLDDKQWNDLGVYAMTKDSATNTNPFGGTYGLIAAVEYEMSAYSTHLQRFALDVNRHGEMKYSAMEYAVRVRSTHGGDFGCLYRVRLHGTPVEKHGGMPDTGARDGFEQSMNDD